jgi:hypothetical protein
MDQIKLYQQDSNELIVIKQSTIRVFEPGTKKEGLLFRKTRQVHKVKKGRKIYFPLPCWYRLRSKCQIKSISLSSGKNYVEVSNNLTLGRLFKRK